MSYNLETGMYEGYIYKIYNDINDKLYIGQTISTLEERWHGHMSALLNEKRYKSALYQAIRKYGKENFHICEIDKIERCCKDDLIKELNILEQKRILEYHSLTYENGYNIELGGDNKKVPGRVVHKYDINLNYIDTYESCNEAGRQSGIDGCTIYGCCKHDYYTAGGYVWTFDGEEPVKPDYSKKEEWNKKFIEMNKNRWLHIPKTKRKYVSRALPEDLKRERRFERLGFNKGKIYVYNAFGEILKIYGDAIDAIENIPITAQTLRKNLSGENLKYKNFVIRYENDPFNKYPMSRNLQAITIYDMNGNIVDCFESIISAEQFVGCGRGEILKTMKRGGSYKNYMFSFYGQPLIRKTLKNIKEINMRDEKHNVIKVFASIKEINEYFGVSDTHHSILKAIKNKIQYRGYYWDYKDEFAINT